MFPAYNKKYILYIRFVLVTDVELARDKISAMTEIIKQWCRSYQKKINKQKFSKSLSDLAKLPTISDVSQLDASAHVEEAKKTFSIFKTSLRTPTKTEFCLCRDYLLTTLILDNAPRAGSISNMTCREYKHMTIQDSSYVIAVAEHKTASSSGPSFVVVRKALTGALETYFVMRNKLPMIECKGESPFFVSYYGKAMAPSMVSSQLNSFWKAAVNCNLTYRLNTTLLRKNAVTKVIYRVLLIILQFVLV